MDNAQPRSPTCSSTPNKLADAEPCSPPRSSPRRTVAALAAQLARVYLLQGAARRPPLCSHPYTPSIRRTPPPPACSPTPTTAATAPPTPMPSTRSSSPLRRRHHSCSPTAATRSSASRSSPRRDAAQHADALFLAAPASLPSTDDRLQLAGLLAFAASRERRPAACLAALDQRLHAAETALHALPPRHRARPSAPHPAGPHLLHPVPRRPPKASSQTRSGRRSTASSPSRTTNSLCYHPSAPMRISIGCRERSSLFAVRAGHVNLTLVSVLSLFQSSFGAPAPPPPSRAPAPQTRARLHPDLHDVFAHEYRALRPRAPHAPFDIRFKRFTTSTPPSACAKAPLRPPIRHPRSRAGRSPRRHRPHPARQALPQAL